MRLAKEVGNAPEKPLNSSCLRVVSTENHMMQSCSVLTHRSFSFVKLPIDEGSKPENWFSDKSRVARLTRLPMYGGTVPESWFPPRLMKFVPVRLPIDKGREPVSLLLFKKTLVKAVRW